MRRLLSLLVALCLCGSLGQPGWAVAKLKLHPQDGPDVDVRIHVEDDVVRATLVFNLAFADELFGILREDEYHLHPIEHEDLHLELFEYLHDEFIVKLDGVPVTPLDRGFDVQDPDPTLLPLFPAFGAKALTKAQIILEYPAKSAPQRVTFVWPAFPPDYVFATPEGIPPIEVNAQLFAGGVTTLVVFRKDEPEYTWHAGDDTYADRFLEVPRAVDVEARSFSILSTGLTALAVIVLVVGWLVPRLRPHRRPVLIVAVLCFVVARTTTDRWRMEIGGGPGLPDEEQALAIFTPLHANIYRAFDYTDESDVYDALARSVHGDLLDRLYNEIFTSLVMQDQGGAVARVQSVDLLESAVEEVGHLTDEGVPGFAVVARWQVEGAVFHWGHSHHRTNEYQARYNVLATDDGWRIADSQILEQRRIEADPIPDGAEGEL